jgi:arabinan endo-1,5-alpha-L-arabinosidase
MKMMGAYNNWGTQTVGECAQGHNSIIAAPDGRTYLVYHTKFNNGTIAHEVRVHQVFQNKNGWLVVAPFEYNGETVTDEQIASTQPFTKEMLTGTYSVLIHKYKMDYKNMEEVTPISITFSADGKVTGDKTGTWSIDEGTGYIKVSLGGTAYNGVVFTEKMDGTNTPVISITAISNSGVSLWAYNTTTSLTGIHSVENSQSQKDTWHRLDGRRLSSKPTTKGLYIQNGKKILVR